MTSEKTSSEPTELQKSIAEKFRAPAFLRHGRDNPINGRNCFFTQATFHKVVGPEPSFYDRFMLQVSRANKPPKKKILRKDLDLPTQNPQEQKPKEQTPKKGKKKTGENVKGRELVSYEELLAESHSSESSKKEDNINEYDKDDDDDDDEPSANLVIADVEDDQLVIEIPEEERAAESKVEEALKDSSIDQNDSDDALHIACDEGEQSCEETVEDPMPVDIPILNSSTFSCDDVTTENEMSSKESKSSLKANSTEQEHQNEDAGCVLEASSYVAGISLNLRSTSVVSQAANSLTGDRRGVSSSSWENPPDVGKLAVGTLEGAGDCLVMPPAVSDSEEEEQEEQETGSDLPLIPALMSGPIKTRKVNVDVAISKPKVASLFHSADQAVDSTPTFTQPRSEVTTAADANVKPGQTQGADYGGDGDGEIPIFAVVSGSPQKAVRRAVKNPGIWTMEETLEDQEETTLKHNKHDDQQCNEMKFRQSELTRAEMATYLHLFDKYVRPYLSGGGRPLLTDKQRLEMEEFEFLQQRVVKEQREFQAYLQQNAMKNPHYYLHIDREIRKYAMDKAKSFRPNFFNFQKKYSKGFLAVIPLQQPPAMVTLNFEKVLLELGAAPKLSMPDVKGGHEPVAIPCDMRKLQEHFPRYQMHNASGFIHHQYVRSDMNVKALAVKYGVSAVMSSSVFKCLMNNRSPGYSQIWHIPVVVLEEETQDGVQKVVYLNKPTFNNTLILRDYNTVYHKYALRTMVSHSRANFIGVRQKGKARAVHDSFDMFATSTKLDAIETFGRASAHTSTGATLNKQSKEFSPVLRKSERVKKAGVGAEHSNLKNLTEQTANDDLCSTNTTESAYAKVKGHSPLTSSSADGGIVHDVQPGALSAVKATAADLNTTEGFKGNSRKQTVTEESVVTAQRESEAVAEPRRSGLRKRPLQDGSLPSSPKRKSEAASPSPFSSEQINSGSGSKRSSVNSAVDNSRKVMSLSPAKSGSGLESNANLRGRKPQFSFSETAEPKSNSLLDMILGPDTEAKSKRHAAPQENPKNYVPHSEALSSLVYSLWSLGRRKVLLRTRCHGTLRNQNTYLCAKMEYQPSHGFEQVTAEEKIRDWAACYIRPHTKLLRARINVFTSEIMMYEELETDQILKPNSDFQPDEAFSFLDSLLDHLCSLENGHYLLSHEPGADFCGLRVAKATEKFLSTAPSMMAEPCNKPPPPGNVPWIPIDTTLMLPQQMMHQRIPATFLPKDVTVTGTGTKKPQADLKVLAKVFEKRKKKHFRKNFQKKVKGEREFF